MGSTNEGRSKNGCHNTSRGRRKRQSGFWRDAQTGVGWKEEGGEKTRTPELLGKPIPNLGVPSLDVRGISEFQADAANHPCLRPLPSTITYKHEREVDGHLLPFPLPHLLLPISHAHRNVSVTRSLPSTLVATVRDEAFGVGEAVGVREGVAHVSGDGGGVCGDGEGGGVVGCVGADVDVVGVGVG